MVTTSRQADLDTRWRSRVQGSLLLATWADAMGEAPETAWIRPDGGRPVSVPPVRLGARLRSMWMLAEHLSRHGGTVVLVELGRALAGQRPHTRAPTPEQTSRRRLWSGGSPASGGLFGRVAAAGTVPVGLVPGIGLETVARRARRAAAVAQPHPQALDVAAMEAVAVAVVAGWTDGPLDADAMIGQLTNQVRAPALLPMLRRVPPMIRLSTNPRQVAMQLHPHPGAARVTPAALTAFLLHPDDPLAAIRFAMRTGGDTRAAAAMTAALCGAHHGQRALPQPLEVPQQLTRIAGALAGLRAPG